MFCWYAVVVWVEDTKEYRQHDTKTRAVVPRDIHAPTGNWVVIRALRFSLLPEQPKGLLAADGGSIISRRMIILCFRRSSDSDDAQSSAHFSLLVDWGSFIEGSTLDNSGWETTALGDRDSNKLVYKANS